MFHPGSPCKREGEDIPDGDEPAEKRVELDGEGGENSDPAPVSGGPSTSTAGQIEYPPSNIVLLRFEKQKDGYPIDVEVIHSICKRTGAVVQRIVIFGKDNARQAMAEFDSIETATAVMADLEGQHIYRDHCLLKTAYGKSDRLNVAKNDPKASWDFTVSGTTTDNGSTAQPLLPDPQGVPKGGMLPTLQSGYGHGMQNMAQMPQGARQQADMSMQCGGNPAPGCHGQQPQPGALPAGMEGSNLQQGSVLMVYGLNNDQMNCKKIFNLFCLYGNVVRVKFLKSKDGVAMIQLGDNAACERALKNINGSFVFGHKMLMGYSKQAYIQDVPNPVNLSDGSISFMDFMGDRNNRFTTPEVSAKNRIQPASRVLYFFNAPPALTNTDLEQVFASHGVKTPKKIKIFPSKTNRSSTGLIEFENKADCIEALVAANHAELHNPNGNNPFILKFCFSDAPIKG